MVKPSFNIYEFKKWLDEHTDGATVPEMDVKPLKLENDPIIGSHAQIKVSEEKAISSIENIDGDKEKILKEFFEVGGNTVQNHGRRVIVQVPSGSFSIPRFCVRLSKT